MKLQVRLRQRHFWCLPFLLLLTHMFSAETMEEQPDDQWMKIRCNDTSPVQMVKVKFSSQVVRNGREYKLYCVSYHVALLLGHIISYIYSHSMDPLKNYRFHIDMEIVNTVHKHNKNVCLRNVVKKWSHVLFDGFQNNQQLQCALLAYTFRRFCMHCLQCSVITICCTEVWHVLMWNLHAHSLPLNPWWWFTFTRNAVNWLK